MLKFELIRAEDVICDICFCKPCLEKAVKLFSKEAGCE